MQSRLVKGLEIERKGVAGQRERLLGMGVGSGCINSQWKSSLGLGLGATLKSARWP